VQEILKDSKNIKILYVEDHKDTNIQTTELLRKIFDNVTSTASYSQAKEHFSDDIDLLITDISLPEKSGIELAKELKELKNSLKIIFISAYNDSEFLLKAIEVGADGFLFKPFTLEDFLKILAKVTKIIKMEKENEEFKKNLIKIIEKKNKKLITDTITGVGNIAKMKAELKNEEKYFAVLVDINRFKKINSAFGFEFGNEVLKTTAKKLSKFSDRVYRIGNDQFIIILENERDFETLKKDLENVVVYFNDFPVIITYSMAGFFSSGEEIINNITKVTDYIKENSLANNAVFLDEAKLQKSSLKSKKLSLLLNLLRENKVEPFFQPIIDIKTKKITKYEVLARIIDNEKIYNPFEFIEDIKKAGLISELTRQLIEKALPFAKKIPLSINITDTDLNSSEMINFIIEKTKKLNINPSNITFEILEDIDTFNSTNLKNILLLKQEGFKIAIDDFGSKYSNFERILKISPDYIKIDGKFIKNLPTEEVSRKIVMAINILAHSLNSKIIAEFVENEEILNIIEEMGIEYAQGYLFSPPKRSID
jgi:EAL domain-containing protein (putative c-di-GMP-specific phosphodiesterase class I)/CheY-like chemotaxis protein